MAWDTVGHASSCTVWDSLELQTPYPHRKGDPYSHKIPRSHMRRSVGEIPPGTVSCSPGSRLSKQRRTKSLQTI